MKKFVTLFVLVFILSVCIIFGKSNPAAAADVWTSGSFRLGSEEERVMRNDKECTDKIVSIVGVSMFPENVSVCVYERPSWRYALYQKSVPNWYGGSTIYYYFLAGIGADQALYVVDGMNGEKKPMTMPSSNDVVIINKVYSYMYYVNTVTAIKDFPSKLTSGLSGPGLSRRYTLEGNAIQPFLTRYNSDSFYVQGSGISKNGRWIVLETYDGLIVVDSRSREIYGFSNFKVSYGYGSDGHMKFAVSDDGKYIAATGLNIDPKIYSLNESCMVRSNEYSEAFATQLRATQSCPDDGGRMRTALLTQFTGQQLNWVETEKFGDDGKLLYMTDVTHQDGYEIPLFSNGYVATNSMDYLALGDSFSSGEGDIKMRENGQSHYEPMTDVSADPSKGIIEEKCHISDRSYPYLLGRDFRLQDYTSIACSGALIGDLGPSRGGYLGQSDSSEKPRLGGMSQTDVDDYQTIGLNGFIPGRVQQIEFVKKYKPRAITLTAGGNDADFANILKICAGENNTCSYAKNADDKHKELGIKIRDQFKELVKLYTSLRLASPNTKIYVVGYPSFMNPHPFLSCSLNAGWTDGEERELYDEATRYMNDVVEAAAKRVGVKYIDIENSLAGGRMCEGLELYDKYVTGAVNFQWSPTESQKVNLFHPNHLGHEKIAQAIKSQLGSATFDSYDYTETPDTSVTVPPYPVYFKESEGFDKNIQNAALIQGDVVKQESKKVATAPYMFMTNTLVTMELHSEPVNLGTAMVKSDGSLDASIDIPSSVPVGYHTLVIRGQSYSGETIEYYQVVLVWNNDPNDRDGDGISDTVDRCMIFPQANVDADQDGIDDGCDQDITEPPTPKELYRIRNGDSTRQYNGASEKTNYLYIERNTKASAQTGVTGDADPDNDGWAIVAASKGSIWGIPDVGPAASFTVQGEGKDAKPLVYVRTNSFGCVAFRPASLAVVTQSGRRNLVIGAVNTAGCRANSPESDNDKNGLPDNTQPLYRVRNGDATQGEDPKKIYLLRSFHGAEAQLGRSDYSYKNEWNILAVTPVDKDGLVMNKLVLWDTGNGKIMPLVFAKNQKGKCVAYVPLWTGTITSFTKYMNPMIKLITPPKGYHCD